METKLEVIYVMENTPYGKCKRQTYKCTRCGKVHRTKSFKFCSNCGAEISGLIREKEGVTYCEDCVHQVAGSCEMYECEFERKATK